MLIQQALRLLKADADPEDVRELVLLGVFHDGIPSSLTPSITLQRLSKHYATVLQSFREIVKQERREQKTAARQEDRNNHLKVTHRTIRGSGTAPLLFVRRTEVGPQFQPIGSIATHPDVVDRIVRNAWADIYAGNVTDEEEHLRNFLSQMAGYLFARKEQFKVDDFTAKDLYHACTKKAHDFSRP